MSEITYKSIGDRNFMLIPCKETGKNIETQIRMLATGNLKNILQMMPTAKNGIPILQYDITGLVKLDSIIKQKKLTQIQFANLIVGLSIVAEECASYALTSNGICFNNEHIFFDTNQDTVKFIYIPTLQAGDPEMECRELLRDLIAYGKVEYSTLVAMVNDAVNSPNFSFAFLKSLSHKFIDKPRKSQNVSQKSINPNCQTPSVEQFRPSFNPPVSKTPVSPVSPPVSPIPSMSVPPIPVPPSGTSKKSKKQKSKGKKAKNIVWIVLTILLSIAIVGGFCFISIIYLPDGNIGITQILSIIVLIALVDFLILRKVLTKTTKQTENTSDSSNKDKVKHVGSAVEPASFIPPVSQPSRNAEKEPAHCLFVPPEKSPLQQTSFPISQNDNAENTVLLDNTIPTGTLCLQTESGEMIPVTKSPFYLGRDRDISDYVIDEKTVGRTHAELNQQENGWTIIDQNSCNHTYINNNRLTPYTPYPLSDGDAITLAKVTLWVRKQ